MERFLRHVSDQRLRIRQDLAAFGVRAVPFEQGEFGGVARTAFARAKARADLKNTLTTGGEHPLHVQFGGGPQPMPRS
jgi:hypothetical protein